MFKCVVFLRITAKFWEFLEVSKKEMPNSRSKSKTSCVIEADLVLILEEKYIKIPYHFPEARKTFSEKVSTHLNIGLFVTPFDVNTFENGM